MYRQDWVLNKIFFFVSKMIIFILCRQMLNKIKVKKHDRVLYHLMSQFRNLISVIIIECI